MTMYAESWTVISVINGKNNDYSMIFTIYFQNLKNYLTVIFKYMEKFFYPGMAIRCEFFTSRRKGFKSKPQ